MTRIAVFGAGGMLGAAMVHGLRAHGYDVHAFDRAAADVTSPAAVAAAVQRSRPAVIVNCAAYNAVDRAEDEPVEALRVNAFAVRTLARAAREAGATFVHFSTDFVFDGKIDRPLTEDDRLNPLSVYGASKMLGEWFAAETTSTYVLRVASLFGRATPDAPERGSAFTMIRGMMDGSEPVVFTDRTVSPTYVPDAVEATRLLMERRAPAGVYHCVSSGWCTWREFAEETARLLQIEPRFRKLSVTEANFQAARPQHCALSNAKLAAVGINMPTWQDALRRHLTTRI